MSTVISPGTLRRVCKEPLAEVKSVQLRGRGITRLAGLDACPKLTSLDISDNSLTELDSASFRSCKELWVVNASNNRLESIRGLSSLMALGYLNLSNNPIPIENLRPLARAHILELFLGSGRSPQERRRTVAFLPNVWVLDDEFVTAQERRTAEDDYAHAGGGGGDDQLLLTWNAPLLSENAGDICSSGRRKVQCTSRKDTHIGYQPPKQQNNESGCGSGFGGLETQGRRVREFYEDVVWKLPSKTEAADTFRLVTLLEFYDKRTAAANTSAWLGTFTCGGVGGGARGRVRRDWSVPLPRPHLEGLMALPLELKLDVVVLLTVRAALWNHIPQQVLAEAFMVLFMSQGGLPDGIHNDLSRVPAFVCTALVHLLRSSIVRLLDESSMPGHANTAAPPLLDRHQGDLIDAIPPVVTGVDADSAFERWEHFSRNRKASGQGGGGVGKYCGNQVISHEVGGAIEGSCEVLTRGDRVSLPHATTVAAATTIEDSLVPTATRSLDGGLLGDNMSACSSGEENGSATTRNTSEGVASGVDWESTVSDEGARSGAADAGATAAASNVASAGLLKPEGGGVANTKQDYPKAYAPPLGIGLTRLCRRAVILLTRSPACPDLVASQTHPAEQRIYDQMEPLLARAKMAYGDLHPPPSGNEIGRGGRNVGLVSSSSKSSHGQYSPSPPMLVELGQSPTATAATGEARGRSGVVAGHEDQDAARQDAVSVQALRSPEAGPWSVYIRRPKAGERVQVFQNVWSVIVTVHPESFSVLVAPFEGQQAQPYRGASCIDSRDLFYDPRGWWRHAPSLVTNAPPAGSGRLHRLARGISATGLPRGAGSLNEPLAENELNRASSGRCECSPMAQRRTAGLPPNRESSKDYHAPAGFPRTPETKASTRCRPFDVAFSDSAPAPALLCRDRRPDNGVVGVFSAEGSWDPVFVMAPPRLVDHQNQTATRKRGRRRARRVAWRRLDGPKASLAPRPMMPRCASLPASSAEARDTYPGSPPRLANVAPSHGGGGGSGGSTWFAPLRSLSVPLINTTHTCSEAAGTETTLSSGEAWLALQREMGTFKADNRMVLRGESKDGGCGTSAHALRASRSAVGVLAQYIAGISTSGSSAAVSVLTKPPAENSTVCAGEVMDLLAKTLSLGLDITVPAWKGEKPGNASASKATRGSQYGLPSPINPYHSRRLRPNLTEIRAAPRSVPEDKPTTVFELTQVGGRPERGTETVTSGGSDSSAREGGGKPSTEKPRKEESQRAAPSSRGDAEVAGGGRETDNSPRAAKPSQHRRRDLPRDGDPAATAAWGRKWKPNAKRPLEWFPVPGRQTFLVDPSDAKAAAAVMAAETAAATGRECPADQGHRSDGAGLWRERPGAGVGAAGGGSAGKGSGTRGAGSGEGRTEQPRGQRNGPHYGGGEGGETGREKQPASERPGNLPGGGGGGGGGGGERSTQENKERPKVLLSARSAFPSSVVSAEKLPSPLATVAGAGASTNAWPGSCLLRSSTSARKPRGWKKRYDAPSGGLIPRAWSTPRNPTAGHSKRKLSETKAAAKQLGSSRRIPTVTHGVNSRVALKAPGGCAVGPPVTPESRRDTSPPLTQSRGGGGKAGGVGEVRVEACFPSAHRHQKRAVTAKADWLLKNRERCIQINRVSLQSKGKRRHATPATRSDTAPRGLRHNERRPSYRRPSPQRSTAVSGWRHEEENVVHRNDDRNINNSFAQKGREAGRIRSVASLRPAPVDSDDSLAECFSVAGTVVSSNSSCCGWNKTSNSQK